MAGKFLTRGNVRNPPDRVTKTRFRGWSRLPAVSPGYSRLVTAKSKVKSPKSEGTNLLFQSVSQCFTVFQAVVGDQVPQ
jgi:hypothetical protein